MRLRSEFCIYWIIQLKIRWDLSIVHTKENKKTPDCFTLLKHKCFTISLDTIRFFSIPRVRTVWLIYGKHVTWLAMQFKSRIDEAVHSVFDFNVCLKTQCDSSNLNKHCGTYNTIFTERLPRILVYELQFLVEPPHKKKRMKSMQITSQFLFINRKFCQYVLMVHLY